MNDVKRYILAAQHCINTKHYNSAYTRLQCAITCINAEERKHKARTDTLCTVFIMCAIVCAMALYFVS